MIGTYVTKSKDIKRQWHLFDARGEILGRLATRVAELLMGKDKTYFTRQLDCGDNVVVINAKEVRLSGKKEEKKLYYRHSGYPGGLKITPFKKLKQEMPTKIIIMAVSGMLPKNKLHDRMLKRLYVFDGEQHPFGNNIKNKD